MPRMRGFGITTVAIVSVASIYMGVNFFQPIVIEQLRKDGNLRGDIDLPKFDKDGNVIIPENIVQQLNQPQQVPQEQQSDSK